LMKRKKVFTICIKRKLSYICTRKKMKKIQ
jgi:hypothetical protein